MNQNLLVSTLAVATAIPSVLHGGDWLENPNRLSLGPRFGMNFKASFKNSAPVNPGLALGGLNHFYNDGYVLLDSAGNTGGQTWNWGYRDPSQVVGDTMQFHAVQPKSGKVSDDPQYGGELTYQRVLGTLRDQHNFLWGVEAGFGFTDLDLRDNPTSITTDTFQLNGVVPPSAGYNGTFVGPGPLLGDTPTRTFESSIATLPGYQKLSGQLYTIRMGPFAEWYFNEKTSLLGSVGLTLAPSSVSYDFAETTTVPGGSTFVERGHSSKTELLYGAYASALIRYEFNPCWGVYAGAQFQSLNDMDLSVGTRSARLDQSATVYGVVGLTWKF